MSIRFADLFAGLGGFHLAGSQVGGKCVFASEIDETLGSVYEKNFGMKPAGDIRLVRPRDVPSHDLLCAGFPCQSFSKAGDQMGWKDTARGTVFFNIVEILRVHKPRFLILENVAHFVRHDEGNTYQRVKLALEALGYTVNSATLSPHWFGVPQIRERMYLVGRRGGLDKYRWPAPTTKGKELRLRDILDVRPSEAKALGAQVVECLELWQEFLDRLAGEKSLSAFPVWSMESGATYPYLYDSLHEVPLSLLRRRRGSFGQPLDTRSRDTLSSRVPSYARGEAGVFPDWKRHFIRANRLLFRTHRKVLVDWTGKIQQFPPSLQKLEWHCHGEKRNIWDYVIQFRASGVRVKRPTTAPSLVAMTTTQVPIIGWEKRYMTARECARLQSMDGLRSLPEGNAAFKALGNAVNVKVARLVLEKLLSLR